MRKILSGELRQNRSRPSFRAVKIMQKARETMA
jgi:hypothetical protein